ncbi:hypothetical protein [Cumulibacter soli]|uniref:hypothetical protein n=1 Tax=Cumulibacter soli TaxID=2546344 RepID=UPI001068AF9A|nr:hypothetical protein [Cumulibacter soli]
MRGRVRADIVVWSTLLLFTVAGLVLLSEDAELSADALRLVGANGRPWLVLPAAAIACGALAARDWLMRCSWPVLQIACAATATTWTACLLSTRGVVYDGTEVGTSLGNALSTWLHDVNDLAGWLAPLIVGACAAAACVLLNAAVQSLSGGIQARRLAPVLALSPVASFVADGALVLSVLSVSGVLALSAMASERGRGLLWSTGLGLASGVLLVASALAGFAGTAAGVGMLCVYFLRRRSLMILVAGLGALATLLLTWGVLGWSWPQEFGEASAFRLDRSEALAAGAVAAAVIVAAIGGPSLRESLRKVRGTPSWPIMITGVVAAVLAMITRPVALGILPAAAVWVPLLSVAASAPPRAAETPDGPATVSMVLTAGCGLGVALAAALLV